jgi:hypothetical protein
VLQRPLLYNNLLKEKEQLVKKNNSTHFFPKLADIQICQNQVPVVAW